MTPVQNIINEKIYLVLWWWYAFLAPLTVIFIAYRIVTIFFQRIRFCLLCRRVRFNPRSIVSKRKQSQDVCRCGGNMTRISASVCSTW